MGNGIPVTGHLPHGRGSDQKCRGVTSEQGRHDTETRNLNTETTLRRSRLILKKGHAMKTWMIVVLVAVSSAATLAVQSAEEKETKSVPARVSKTADEAQKRALAEELFVLLKDDYITVYAETFTVNELKSLIELYRTPPEKKLVAKQAELSLKLTQLAQKRVAGKTGDSEPSAERKESAKKLEEASKILESATRKLDELDKAVQNNPNVPAQKKNVQ